MLAEVEDGLAIAGSEVEVAARGDDLVFQRHRLRHDLAGRRDDGALADHVGTLLDAALRGADDPGRVLVGAGLHRQVVVELREAVDVLVAGVIIGRVVAEHDHLDTLQSHDSVGLGPPPVVAYAHAHDAAECLPHFEAVVARLEVALLEVLVGPAGLRLGMAGKMHLAVLSDDVAGAVDEDRGVEAPLAAIVDDEFRIAEIEPDAEFPGFVEERLGVRPRHLLFVVAVELGLVLDQPARKEGRQRHLREDDEVGVARLCLAHHGDEARDRVLAGFRLRNGSHLGGCGVDDPCHWLSSCAGPPLAAR